MNIKRFNLGAFGGMFSAMCLVSLGLGGMPAAAAPPVKEDVHASVTQNWDKALPSVDRFVILPGFNNAVVRDNNTGLVWERSPSAPANTWSVSRTTCLNSGVGVQKGWRLPSIVELMSLVDESIPAPGPKLPPGHPFQNVPPLS